MLEHTKKKNTVGEGKELLVNPTKVYCVMLSILNFLNLHLFDYFTF